MPDASAPDYAPLFPPPPDKPVELFCLECGYNLSGTTEDRCSECGHPFDRAALTAWTSEHHQPLPFGPLEPIMQGSSLVQASLFSPSRLGRLLPPFADANSAGHHSLVMRLWAGFGVPFLFLVIAAICVGDGAALIPAFLIPLPTLIASSACEALIAANLGKFVPARAVPPEQQGPFWRILLRCFSTHLLMTSLLFCLAVVVMIASLEASRHALGGRGEMVLLCLPYLAAIGSILWWWYGLGQAITARGLPCAARTVIILLIPLIALAMIAFGVALCMVESYITFAACRV